MAISGERFRAREQDLLVAIATGLFAAGLCFLPPTVFESGDFVLCWKPAFHFLAESVRDGSLPLWNPYVGLGRPFLADTTNVVCYPPTYLICLGQEFGVFLLTIEHAATPLAGGATRAGAPPRAIRCGVCLVLRVGGDRLAADAGIGARVQPARKHSRFRQFLPYDVERPGLPVCSAVGWALVGKQPPGGCGGGGYRDYGTLPAMLLRDPPIRQ